MSELKCTYTVYSKYPYPDDEIDSLRAKIESMLHEVQKHQPVGSPPPGDETMLVRWIMDTLHSENAKLREDITGYRRTVSRQHSDLARLRELLGEVDTLRVAVFNIANNKPPYYAYGDNEAG